MIFHLSSYHHLILKKYTSSLCPSHQVSANIYFQFNYNVLKLKNMIAALYSSRDNGGTKDFVNSEGIHFGWETIEEVYRMDMKRAKNGQTRKFLN